MPEHLGKKKAGLHNASSTQKTALLQDDSSKKDISKVDIQQDDLRPPEENSPEADNQSQDGEKPTEEEIQEEPKKPYDAMRVEPILTRLIVEKYEGGVDENGFFEGEGAINFVGGHFYKGNLQNKKMNGQGVYYWADGTTYAGEFIDNSICGKGVYSWPDGSIYEGDVKNGLRHGNGTYKCGTCPSLYTGEWVNGMRHGKGILYFDEGCESYYDGEWKDGTKCGYGIHKYRSGNVYEGWWQDNIRNGRGKMCWFDRGEEYDGEWVNGIQNGRGRHTWYSKRVAVSQYPIRNEYEGDFINGQRHGYGTFYYASGAKYSGQWVKNVKSGKGEFMFKNGSVFKGMFENDHIMDYPDLVPSGMTTPDIVESGIPVRSQTPMRPSSGDLGIGSVDDVLDINLKEVFINEKFDIDRQQLEIDEVTRVVLRYMTPLKHIYKYYSSLGVKINTDNTFVMNRLKFWRFFKDCGLQTVGYTLAQIDLVDGLSETKDDPHDRSTIIYMRDFVNLFINIAFLLFKSDFPQEQTVIAKCVLKMLIQYVLPNACMLKGNMFSSPEKMKEAEKYIEGCDEVFDYFRSAKNRGEMTKALRVRDFLWILKDFKLLNSGLTTSGFLDAVYSEDATALEERSFNLDNEIVFLEFFETLLECSQKFDVKSADLSEKANMVAQTQTAVSSAAEIKSSVHTKDEEDSVTAENATERFKTPSNLQSPDKSTIFVADATSTAEQSKSDVGHSPTTKTHESTSHGKSSAAAGGRKDHHGGKESGGLSASRGRRRGTADHVDTENKFGSATNPKSKDKGGRDREKHKNGSKSAKKVVIEDEKDKSSANVTLHSQAELENENQSTLQFGCSATESGESAVQQTSKKLSENDTKQVNNSQVLSVGNEDSMQTVEDGSEKRLPGDSFPDPVSMLPASSHGDASVEPTALFDENEAAFHTWSTNLHTFFRENFFPAFQIRKKVDETLKEKKS